VPGQELPKAPKYPDRSRLLEWRDDDGNPHPVQNLDDWARRREHFRIGMQEIMGPVPLDRQPLDIRIRETADNDTYTRFKIDYQPEPGDRVPAYLLVPKNRTGRGPAMMCLHQTVQIGKDEPAGLGGSPNLHYADELARRGYVCLVPDYPTLGEYTYDFDKDRYPSGSMKAIFNHIRGVDLLIDRPDVDPERIGTIGHSLGGHNSMFLATFDTRVRAVVSCCGFTPHCHYYGGDMTGWTGPRYCPRIKDYLGRCGEIPFDFYEMVAGFAPRAFLTVSPIHDSNFDVAGVQKVIKSAAAVYKMHGVTDHLQARYPDAPHDFPPEDRQAAYAFLDKHLLR
jgi:pimeloyl-ACP methyl ester carboxylesterase